MKPKLPGLGPIALLMLTPILSVWLGLFGSLEFSKLKDWQPLLAACIVFAAGVLAYKGSMAKVEFDRGVHEREIRRNTLAIYLRLDFATKVLLYDMELLAYKLRHRTEGDTENISVEALLIPMAPELKEAWDNMDIFPAEAAKHLSSVRLSLMAVHQWVNGVKRGTNFAIAAGLEDNRPETIKSAEAMTIRVRNAAKLLEAWLKGEIRYRGN